MTEVASAIAQLAAAVVATVCNAVAARRTRSPWRAGWILAAVSTGAVAVGGLIVTYDQVADGFTPTFPSLDDAGFVTAYVAAIAACLAFLRASGLAKVRLEVTVETLMVTAGLLSLSWETVLIPLLQIHSQAGLARLDPTVYPIGDIVVVSLLVSLLIRAPLSLRTPLLLYAGGMAAIAVWDSAMARPQATGAYVPGGLPDALLVSGYLCLACAALWAATHADVDLSRPGIRAPLRLRIVYVPVVLGVGAAIIKAGGTGRAIDPGLFAIVLTLMSLIIARQFLLLRDHTRALARLAAREQEREQLLRRVLDTSDRERQRLAADLHDGVIQLSAALGLRSTALARRLRRPPMPSPERLAETAAGLESITAGLGAITGDLRTLMGDLANCDTERQGLQAALQTLVEPLAADGVEVTVTVSVGATPGEARIHGLLFRVAQELVRNVVKHADARHLTLSVSSDATALRLTVTDDGRGFQRDDVQRRRRSGGLGLSLLERRVRDAGGELRIHSRPGQGTAAEALLPHG